MANDVVVKVFEDTVECQKCGLDTNVSEFEDPKFKITYCPSAVISQACEGLPADFDHLHVVCNQCQYTWLMKTKDREEGRHRGAHAESTDFQRGRRGSSRILHEE